MDQALITKAANLLRVAAETNTPIAPLRNLFGSETDVEMAYAVQAFNTDADVDKGRRIVGRKIGLTAEVVQRQLGVNSPDFGTLFSDMCFADGIDIPAGRLIQPRAEAEIAFVLAHDLDKGQHCAVDIINATAYVLPSLEIVDSRIENWDIRMADTVADNASCGVYVVGSQPVPLAAINLPDVPMVMQVNGKEVSTGVGAACLGNPIRAAVWLADVMSQRGTPLRAGECIMSGALGPMIPIQEGDAVFADLGALGTVSTKLRKAE